MVSVAVKSLSSRVFVPEAMTWRKDTPFSTPKATVLPEILPGSVNRDLVIESYSYRGII
jgi:hypothetical protein